MNIHEHIATTAAEEACEVGQRITKGLRFGFQEVQPGQTLTNAERIMEEFHQLASCIQLLMNRGMIPDGPIAPTREQVEAKRASIMKYADIGRANGVLDPDDRVVVEYVVLKPYGPEINRVPPRDLPTWALPIYNPLPDISQHPCHGGPLNPNGFAHRAIVNRGETAPCERCGTIVDEHKKQVVGEPLSWTSLYV